MWNPALILDQTPLKYILDSDKKVALRGSISVLITFLVNLDGKFLHPQLIYGDRTTKSLPRVKFTSSFYIV